MYDFRNIENGRPLPGELYTDQPYIVVCPDGSWVCSLTTAKGHEGTAGQHVGITLSKDKGETWSSLYFLEGDDKRESSYSTLLLTSFNRIYCFYNFNTENLRFIDAEQKSMSHRVDMTGDYVFRYSDDFGNTWSKRYVIPVRETKIDRKNPYQGKVRMAWNVGKPFITDNDMYITLHKVGQMLTLSEGWMLKCNGMDNIKNVEQLIWETLPKGQVGIKAPKNRGDISEEQYVVMLSDKSFYCSYRTISGYSAETYSRDKAITWETPEFKKYEKGGYIKNPRAANPVWKCKNGKYLLWYHNNSTNSYDNRNPVFLCAAKEKTTDEGALLLWSQPEVVLYHDDPSVRMSYPDFIECDNRYYITETQKLNARIHEIPADFLEKMWNQFDKCMYTDEGLIVDAKAGENVSMPKFEPFAEIDRKSYIQQTKKNRGGITVEIVFSGAHAGKTLFDNTDETGKGMMIRCISEGRIETHINDGMHECVGISDEYLIDHKKSNHVAVILDAGPNIMSFVINGKYNDGGKRRPFGFYRISPYFRDINGRQDIIVDKDISILRIYSKALMTCEIISNEKWYKSQGMLYT